MNPHLRSRLGLDPLRRYPPRHQRAFPRSVENVLLELVAFQRERDRLPRARRPMDDNAAARDERHGDHLLALVEAHDDDAAAALDFAHLAQWKDAQPPAA